jgi:hypothetical protein
LGEYEKAFENYNRALVIFEIALPKNHPYTEMARKNIKALKER